MCHQENVLIFAQKVEMRGFIALTVLYAVVPSRATERLWRAGQLSLRIARYGRGMDSGSFFGWKGLDMNTNRALPKRRLKH